MWHDSYAMHGDCGEMNFDPSFKQVSLMEQLSKIIDSAAIVPGVDLPENKYKPVTTVITDDGDSITVTAAKAKAIRQAIFDVPANMRLEVIKFLQTTEGLTKYLEKVII